jgi:hypothetical protein
MLQTRPQGAPRAPDTCPGPLPSSTPQEHQGPSITERIDRILSTSSRTNSLEVTELRCLVTDAITILHNVKQLIAAPAPRSPRSLSTKPTTTESLLSQVWDDIQQLKQAQHAPTSTGSSGQSWASIAAQPDGPQLRAYQPRTQSTKPTARQMRELKICFPEKNKQQTVLDNSNQDIFLQINVHFPLAAKAVGIKRLPSRDLIIQILYKEAKKVLQDNQK